MNRPLLALGLALALAPAALSAPPASGTYELAVGYLGTGYPVCLLKLDVRAGAMSGEVVAAPSGIGNLTVEHVALDGDLLRFELKGGRIGPQAFEGRVGKDGVPILGSLETRGRAGPARLALTDKTELKAGRPAAPEYPELWKRATELANKGLMLQIKARETEGAEEKEKLRKEAAAADEEARRELPGLYREVVAKLPGTPYAVTAAHRLLVSAGKVLLTNDLLTGVPMLVAPRRSAASRGT